MTRDQAHKKFSDPHITQDDIAKFIIVPLTDNKLRFAEHVKHVTSAHVSSASRTQGRQRKVARERLAILRENPVFPLLLLEGSALGMSLVAIIKKLESKRS